MAAFRGSAKFQVARRLFSTVSSSVQEKQSVTSIRTVKSAIRSESDPEKIAEIFRKSSDFSRFLRERPVFDLSVRKLAGLGRFDLIERILEHPKSLTNSPVLKSEGFWIRIMMLYSNSRMIDHAVRTFDQMEERGCKRTEKSLCAILSVFLENRRFDRIRECFEDIPPKIGVSPGTVSHNLVLKSLCREKSMGSARSLIDKMEKENGVKPDINSYNILLEGYLKSGDETKFDEIVKEISRKGLNPNLTTYNHRISKLCRSKESVRANKLLHDMVSKGIEPNLASYNAVIDGFCKVGDFESAKKVLDELSSNKSVSPNADTYGTLICHLVEEGEFELALDMCERSIVRNWIPPFASVEGLVNGLVKMSKMDEAKNFVEKMRKKLKGSAVDSWMKVEAALPLREAN